MGTIESEKIFSALDAFRIEPVSYTHLDVYKRQAQDSPTAGWRGPVQRTVGLHFRG